MLSGVADWKAEGLNNLVLPETCMSLGVGTVVTKYHDEQSDPLKAGSLMEAYV